METTGILRVSSEAWNHKFNLIGVSLTKPSECAIAYGLEFDEDALHDALADTRLCAEVMLKQFSDLKAKNVETFDDMIAFLN